MGGRWWTKEEDNVLIRHYPSMSREDLKRLLPYRTWKAIQNRARVLGVHRYEVLLGEKEVKDLDKVSDLKRGFIAGIIEGEGSIMLRRCGKYFTPTLKISNTSMKLLKDIQKVIGGKIIKQKRYAGRKQVFALTIEKLRDIVDVLEWVKPLLITKAKQANLLLKYCKKRLITHRTSGYGREIYIKIKELNKRGTSC